MVLLQDIMNTLISRNIFSKLLEFDCVKFTTTRLANHQKIPFSPSVLKNRSQVKLWTILCDELPRVRLQALERSSTFLTLVHLDQVTKNKMSQNTSPLHWPGTLCYKWLWRYCILEIYRCMTFLTLKNRLQVHKC